MLLTLILSCFREIAFFTHSGMLTKLFIDTSREVREVISPREEGRVVSLFAQIDKEVKEERLPMR